ncbi:DinB family protein [Mucilaginibacter sp.]|uniref:DinB family protein n=1 Tax=Mucilaginibacter sp. TaxID=1882438 RepID=UPI002633E03C|nr:DinB family protein [Mucilaginibacter sp.]MDB5128258.1 hypothetical protein [Mucilaginibacter sp.]
MKSYFISLFNYDRFANTQIANLILETGISGKSLDIMSHLLVAQQTWLKRCTGQPAPTTPLWPQWPADEFINIIDENHEAIIAYLETLQPQDFDKKITYKNSIGQFENTLSDILAHLVNHGTHHRAQIGQHLKMAGAELPASDYILYIRNLNQAL